LNDQNPPKSLGVIPDNQLPLEVIVPSGKLSAGLETERKRRRALPRYFLLPFIPLLLFTGAFVGIYVQPPALRAFLRVTGLKPGGGTSNPIAVPVEQGVEELPKQSTIRSVVALGRLMPDGKVITVSPPYGAADARIEEIKVTVGSLVARGDTLALLDNNQSLEATLESAEANVALQKATLEQTRRTVIASFEEAKAALERANAGAKLAAQDLQRQQELRKRNATAQADLDQAEAIALQAQRDVAKAEATVSRYESLEIEDQPDVVVADRKLDSAMADLNRARRDLARGVVTAPVTGTILDIHVRPGEKPGTQGILDIGNVQRMTAELEVYQSEIGSVAIGQQVELTADAFNQSLNGTVTEIGYEVERQTVIRDDPASNTDARVVIVKVSLDEESSKRAAKLTNLEVTGRIAVEDPR
jgi:HlyD family secretion protein